MPKYTVTLPGKISSEIYPLHVGLLPSLLHFLTRRLLLWNTNGRFAVTSSLGVVVRGTWDLASELLERLSLGLRDQQRSEAAAKHKEGEDLHDVVEPWIWVLLGWVAFGSERAEHSLGNDSTNLSGGSRDTVRCRSVSGREAFSWHNKCGGVGSEVEEELGQYVKSHESTFVELVVSKTDDGEDDGEQNEAHQLNRFAANGVDSCDSDPVTWNGACAHNDQVADCIAVEDLVDGITLGEPDSAQDDGIVETKTIEGNLLFVSVRYWGGHHDTHVQEEPRSSSSQENLAMLPLTVVSYEVSH